MTEEQRQMLTDLKWARNLPPVANGLYRLTKHNARSLGFA